MKKQAFFVLLMIILIVAMLPISVFAEIKEVNKSNKSRAISEFDIDKANIIDSVANTTSKLEQDFAKAESLIHGSTQMAMVYATENVTIDKNVIVPTNVVLTVENTTVFSFTSKSYDRIYVQGSVYGGKYLGNNNAGHVFELVGDFSGKNGYVEHTIIDGSSTNGIFAGDYCKHGKALYNRISNCGFNGIRAQYNALLDIAEGNEVTGCGQSGVDLDHASCDYILNNKLHDNTGHGVSTNTEYLPEVPSYAIDTPCIVKDIKDNSIHGNGHGGIWIEENCQVTSSIENNTIYSNGTNGIGMDQNTVTKNVSFNKVYKNGLSNISILGGPNKRSTVEIGSRNVICSSIQNGIKGEGNAIINVTGVDNEVKTNKLNGIRLYTGSKIEITGSMTIEPVSELEWGILLTDGSVAKLNNTIITGEYSISYDSTCKFSMKNSVAYGEKRETKIGVEQLSARALDSGTAYINWNKVDTSANTKYLLYRRACSSSGWGKAIATLSGTSYTDTQVKSGVKYYYRIKPAFQTIDGWKYGSYSPIDYAYPRIDPIQGFRSYATSSTATKLTWEKGLDQNAEYWIYKGNKSTGNWGDVYAKVRNGKTSFTESYPNVKPNHKYYYMMREVVKGRDGKYYFGPYTQVEYAYPRVNVPTGFGAKAIGKHTVKVYWDKVSGDNVKYQVYTKIANGVWTKIATTSSTSYINYNLKSGQKYYYKVRAIQSINGKTYYSNFTKVDYGYPR